MATSKNLQVVLPINDLTYLLSVDATSAQDVINAVKNKVKDVTGYQMRDGIDYVTYHHVGAWCYIVLEDISQFKNGEIVKVGLYVPKPKEKH
jgi:hypothetical protein